VREEAPLHEPTPALTRTTDGLQNERRALTVAQKLELVSRGLAAGPDSVEVASFVRGDLVPAMAGAAELTRALADDAAVRAAKSRGVGFAALVPNPKGFEAMHKANESARVLDTVVVLVSCSESHSRANVNRSMGDALAATLDVVRAARERGYAVRAYASLAFGCPFEGRVPEDVVEHVVREYRAAGADWMCLADTLGVAAPEQVRSLVGRAVAAGFPLDRVALHLHDSHGRAHENVAAGLDAGVRSFDAAVGGCGGCNFIPGAAGNVSVEKVARVCAARGVAHALDLAALARANEWLADALGRRLEGRAEAVE